MEMLLSGESEGSKIGLLGYKPPSLTVYCFYWIVSIVSSLAYYENEPKYSRALAVLFDGTDSLKFCIFPGVFLQGD